MLDITQRVPSTITFKIALYSNPPHPATIKYTDIGLLLSEYQIPRNNSSQSTAKTTENAVTAL